MLGVDLSSAANIDFNSLPKQGQASLICHIMKPEAVVEVLFYDKIIFYEYSNYISQKCANVSCLKKNK